MKKETILKLLKSPVYEDVILGLNYIKDYTWEELLKLSDMSETSDKIVIRTSIKGDLDKDNYLLNDKFHCHYNAAINIYDERDPKFSHLIYHRL